MTDNVMNAVDSTRRNLLKGGAAAAIVTLAPGVTLQTVQAAVTGPATTAKGNAIAVAVRVVQN